MHFDLALLVLFAVATFVAILARRLRMPYTVALVVAGLVLGTSRLFTPPHLTKELLYAVFLPGLVFEAAFHLDAKRFWQNKYAITGLAVPGVLVAIGLTAGLLTGLGGVLHLAEGFAFAHALVFAAMIVATDPIAVVGLFKSLGAPKRLAVIVEGESLVNDGTAVVIFSLVLAAVSGGHVTALGGVAEFVRVVGAGVAIGLAMGVAASRLTSLIEDPMVEITITVMAAYGSFSIAERFHFSGIIATLAAGMVCGNYGAKTGMSPSTRLAVESFWEYVAFSLNSVIFLLIGFEVRLSSLGASWRAILLAYLAVMLGRALTVALTRLLLRRSSERMPRSWGAVLTWGGLRGSLSMVLALALPAQFPHRELLITMTFGVVIVSILLQGLTMGPLLRRLGLAHGGRAHEALERLRAELVAARAGASSLDAMARAGTVPAYLIAEARARYEARIERAEHEGKEIHLQAAELQEEARRTADRQLLSVERDAVQQAVRSGALDEDAAEAFLRALDAQLVALKEGLPTPEPLPIETATSAPEPKE